MGKKTFKFIEAAWARNTDTSSMNPSGSRLPEWQAFSLAWH